MIHRNAFSTHPRWEVYEEQQILHDKTTIQKAIKNKTFEIFQVLYTLSAMGKELSIHVMTQKFYLLTRLTEVNFSFSLLWANSH